LRTLNNAIKGSQLAEGIGVLSYRYEETMRIEIEKNRITILYPSYDPCDENEARKVFDWFLGVLNSLLPGGSG
jgi:hypothetical protein